MPEPADAVEAIGGILERGGDADDVLREVVEVLERRYDYVAIEFVEGERTVLGPARGAEPAELARLPVTYEGSRVGSLVVGPPQPGEGPLLERVATLIAPYVLVGWDTGGVPWGDA